MVTLSNLLEGRVSRPIHPFPARMAPDLALERLATLPAGSIVLDPMAGSGTVLRQATTLGHRAKGFDVDPLAVMMARASVNPVNDTLLDERSARLQIEVRDSETTDATLPWIDEDHETEEFIDYWFASEQKAQLRRFAAGLARLPIRAPFTFQPNDRSVCPGPH